jgi:ATP-dependent RNA helicase RhlB
LLMDFHRFGIDARLAEAAEGLKVDSIFFEKLLAHSLERAENVCAKISLNEGREEVILLPVLQWLLAGESRKALVLTQDSLSGDRFAEAVVRLGAKAGIGLRRATRDAEGAVRLDGDPTAAILMGGVDELLALTDINLHDYGFLVVDGADRVAEQPSDSIHKLVGLLLPSWERRSLLACAKISVKAKNLAWDLADNPVEIGIDGEVIKAQSVVKETWNIAGEDKLRFLLGLIEREKPQTVCVFCNLKDTAKDLSKRLEANGISSDYILGALAMERKLAVLAKAISGELPCLVLTDQGAEGLSEGSFPLVVNYDIPLEPELFVKRLELLDRGHAGAKVVSLACDRYIYGLSAVESYIDANLEAHPVDEALLAVEDKSEKMSPEPQDRRGAEGRRESGNERGRSDGRGDGSGPQRRDANRRDTRQRREAPHGASFREDRSPDIRRSISDATGGSLDIGGNSRSAEKPRGQDESRRQQPSPASGAKDGRGGRGSEGHRRPEGHRKPEGQRKPDGRRKPDGQRRPEGQRGERGSGKRTRSSAPRQVQRPSQSGDLASKNPYDMPIEERMKRYREKYSHDFGARGSEGEQRGGQQRVAKKDAVPPRGQRDVDGSPRSPNATPAPGRPKGGFLSRLLGSKKRG